MKIKIILTSIILTILVFSTTIYAQGIDSSTISYNKSGTVSWVSLNRPSNIPESGAVSFLKTFLANGSSDVDFDLYSNETDQQSFTHQKFYQTYKGVKVYTGQYFAHSNNGYVSIINGNYVPVNVNTVIPSLTESQALTYALSNINATSYKWQNVSLESAYKQNQNNPNATYFPVGQLIIVPKDISGLNTDILAYMFKVACEQPSDDITVIINANNGDMIKKYSDICYGNTTGQAITQHSDQRDIISNYNSVTNDYKLEVLFNGSFKKVTTKDYNTSNTFTNSSGPHWINWANANPNDRVALDAHWGITQTLDYWENKHQRYSIDPKRPNLGITTYVHAGNVNTSKFSMLNNEIELGDGDVVLQPLTSIDICAHEIGHGISIYSAQINPSNSIETYAISEALSDIWGACVKNYVNVKFNLNKLVWLSGDQIIAANKPKLPYVRSLSNPTIGLDVNANSVLNNLPDCYLGTNWNNLMNTPSLLDGHYACGVVNKWFYFLLNGSVGFTNDAGVSIAAFAGIQPLTGGALDFDKAAQIIYKAETQYLSSGASFSGLRVATIQAAIDLTYLGSPEEQAVTNAWHAVNVGSAYVPHTPANCNTSSAIVLDNISNATTPQTFVGGYYFLPNDATITSDVTFTNATIFVQNEASIEVEKSLSLFGCHLQTCVGMWKGITIKPGGKLNIDGNVNKSTLVEDAKVGVFYDGENRPQTNYIGSNIININNAIFNRCNVGVQIENYAMDANPNVTMYPFSIKNTIFTSRKIANANGTWNNVSTIRGVAIPNSYSSPYISAAYQDNAPEAYLKDVYSIGYSTEKPFAGILLNSIGILNTSGIDASILIGDAANSNSNIFDNLQYGIKATATNLTVNNSTFQKPVGAGIGISIVNTNTNVVDISTPTGPNNAFFDMKTAIYISQGKKILISNCDIRSAENHNTATNINELGRQGIYLSTSYYDKIDVLNNNIQNIRNGIVYSLFSEWAPYFKVGDLSISSNHIGDNYLLSAATPPSGGTFVQNAVSLFAQLTSGGTSSSVSTLCDGNFIQAAYGIKATYFQGQSVQITNNYIKAIPSAFLAASNPELFGICLEGGSRDPFNDVIVQDNTVEGSANVGNNVAGIFVNQQSDAQIGCNTVKTSSSGYKFTGFCPGTKFTDNFINSDNKNGVYLSKAIIGTQGNDGSQNANDFCPSNNSWTQDANWWKSTSPRQYMIYNDNSDPMSSEFVVRSGKFNPAGGGFAPLIGQNYDVNIGVKLVAGNDGGQCSRCNNRPKRILNVQEMLDEIAAGTILLPNDEAQRRLEVMQQQLYELVKAQPELAANSTDIQQFIYDNQWQSLDFIYYLSYFAAKGKMDVVDNLLNYWLPTSSELDDNYRTYYEWLVAMYNNPDYTPNKDEVLALANKCPIKNGTIIYAVRNLYNALTKEIHRFEDNCDGNGQARGIKPVGGMIRLKQPKAKESITTNADKVLLFPNPASSIFTLSIEKGKINTIELVNILGKTVKTINNLNTNIITIETKGINKGIYLVKVVNSNKVVSIQKLIIE